MRRKKPKPKEEICPACNGTGVEPVIEQPPPGRRIFPPRCRQCNGKGRFTEAAD